MQKYKCTISYDGTNYSGFQFQTNANTIQAEIEKGLRQMHKGEEIKIHPSGRTDKGVHALAQVFHFESALNIPVENWKKALNALIPTDIAIHKIEKVDDSFHARIGASDKEYRYYVLNRQDRDVFRRNHIYHEPIPLDIDAMQQACKVFEGTHDFTSFSSAKSTVKGSKVRTLFEVSCHKHGDEIEFVLRGNGFLYNMVRIIVGVLIDVGKGKFTAQDIIDMFAKKHRQDEAVTLPPEGLYLCSVSYDAKSEAK